MAAFTKTRPATTAEVRALHREGLMSYSQVLRHLEVRREKRRATIRKALVRGAIAGAIGGAIAALMGW